MKMKRSVTLQTFMDYSNAISILNWIICATQQCSNVCVLRFFRVSCYLVCVQATFFLIVFRINFI